MYEQDLKELIDKVKKAKAEFQNVELKKCKDGVTERLFDTLSSFSNQDDGGVIIFGIDESSNYEITGIDDVQLLQKKVMEQCQQMEPPVRAVLCHLCDQDLYPAADRQGINKAADTRQTRKPESEILFVNQKQPYFKRSTAVVVR